VVLGGGNVKRLKELPPRCRAGDNANAFLGGFRLWEQARERILTPPHRFGLGKRRRRKGVRKWQQRHVQAPKVSESSP
jgi:hypothetical protein